MSHNLPISVNRCKASFNCRDSETLIVHHFCSTFFISKLLNRRKQRKEAGNGHFIKKQKLLQSIKVLLSIGGIKQVRPIAWRKNVSTVWCTSGIRYSAQGWEASLTNGKQIRIRMIKDLLLYKFCAHRERRAIIQLEKYQACEQTKRHEFGLGSHLNVWGPLVLKIKGHGPGGNLLKIFKTRVTTLLWNKALWLDVVSHLWHFNQSDSIIFKCIIISLLWNFFIRLFLLKIHSLLLIPIGLHFWVHIPAQPFSFCRWLNSNSFPSVCWQTCNHYTSAPV